MQTGSVEVSRIENRWRSGSQTSSVDGLKKAFCPFSMMFAPLFRTGFQPAATGQRLLPG
jgi:hypothetical protein